MRLAWYTGVSTALAVAVVVSAFQQRANFYSATVYLAQSNFCLLVLINFVYILYGLFMFSFQRLCFGPLRAVEVEQLSDRAWIAITETCLAMTIFRDELGAWFLVMFTGLVTAKVWGWIGDGRLEVLEQQPPANPRLFHTRLVCSLLISTVYDFWALRYCLNTVIQQARPNMMVMFLFEYAVLTATSLRTDVRYILHLFETRIVAKQTRKRLEDRRREVQQQREEMLLQREVAQLEGRDVPGEPLPDPNDIDEIDIEVPGWEAKGQWILTLELLTDFIKLAIYTAFFSVLMMFYGLPVHILRDLYLTGTAFFKRLSALIKYRRAIQSMQKYPDATPEDLGREDTCIICREEMQPWDPARNPGAVERSRPKKLPCGHILHFGCLRSWLERQQVCPTCRSPVAQGGQGQRQSQNRQNAPRPQLAVAGQGQAQGVDGQQPQPPVQPQDRAAGGEDHDGQAPGEQRPNHRQYNFGPFRFEFIRHGARANIDDVLQARLQGQVDDGDQQGAGPSSAQQQQPAASGMQSLTPEFEQFVQRELASLQSMQNMQQELQTAHLLMAELVRLRQLNQQQEGQQGHHQQQQPIQDPFQAALAAQGLANSFHPYVPLGQGLPPLPQTRTPPPHTFNPRYPFRASTPSVTRHNVPPNTTAIHAGSPDLPEGLVIPPGWSLLPLQRMDAPQSSTPPPQASANGHAPESNPRSGHAGPSTTAPGVNQPSGTNGSSVLPVQQGDASTSSAAGTALDAARPSTTTPEPTTSSPPVVAPNPVMPNWGGSAQLLGEQRGISPDPPSAKPPSPQGSAPETAAETEAEAEDGPSDKGKGRAVTVEEAEDEE